MNNQKIREEIGALKKHLLILERMLAESSDKILKEELTNIGVNEESIKKPSEHQIINKIKTFHDKKVVAIVVGHKKKSPGACSIDHKICEFEYNRELADMIVKVIDNNKHMSDMIQPIIVFRQSYKDLPQKINKLNPDFVISLHSNAYNHKASGTKVLYYITSKKGKKMAEILFKKLDAVLQLGKGGIRPKSVQDRGGFLLKYTAAPCVIGEPFFIDNPADLQKAMSKKQEIAEAYALAIKEIVKTV